MTAEHQSRTVLVDQAKASALRGDWLEAGRGWGAVSAQFPDYPPAYLGAAHAFRRVDRFDEAEQALEAGAAQLPAHEQIALERARLANARKDWQTALSRWDDVRSRFPENPWAHLGSAQALRGADRGEEAAAMLVAAENAVAAAGDSAIDPKATQRLTLEIARLRGDWQGVRQSVEALIENDPQPTAELVLTLARACWSLGDADGADTAAQRALSIDPDLAEAWLVRERVATERGDSETALGCYRALVGLDRGVVQWSLKLVQLLNWFGHVDEAVAELEQVRARWPDNPAVRTFLRAYGPASALVADGEAGSKEGDPGRSQYDTELQAIAGKAPCPEQRKRPVLVADPRSDVLLAEASGTDAAVLVFTGSNDTVAMPLTMFDPFLAALNLTAIYLKDFHRLRFLTGIRSLGVDYATTLTGLRGLLDRLGVRRLYAIGNCDGGFAAIRYGVELGAERILTFGAPTHSPQVGLAKIEAGRNFMRNRLAANVPAEMMDLKPFLEARNRRTQIEFFYETGDERDCVHAAHLEGLPGIDFHPLALSSRHDLLRRIALQEGDFGRWLGKTLVPA